MEISQLEYLSAAVRHGCYAKATSELHVSPQTISKSIIALQRELKINLFEKDGRGVVPTQAAFEIAAKVDRLLSGFEDIREFALEHQVGSDVGVIALYLYDRLEGDVLDTLDLNTFSRKHPDIVLSVHHSPNDACIVALENGIADAAIVKGNIGNDLVGIKLFELTYAFSREHNTDASEQLIKVPVFFAFNPQKSPACLPTLKDHIAQRVFAAPLYREIT